VECLADLAQFERGATGERQQRALRSGLRLGTGGHDHSGHLQGQRCGPQRPIVYRAYGYGHPPVRTRCPTPAIGWVSLLRPKKMHPSG
jgi:hypothetical protein